MIDHVISYEYIHTCSLAYFLQYVPLFLMMTCMNNFQVAKVYPRGAA